jgi:hypothetical protein
LASGFDPAFGFLHHGQKPGRQSLAYDCLELLRGPIDRSLLDYANGRRFMKADFPLVTPSSSGLTRGADVPIVRCGQTVARDLVRIAKGLDVEGAVERLAGMIMSKD